MSRLNGLQIANPTPSVFHAWVANKPKGAVFVYHIGHLSEDRGPEDDRIDKVNNLARAVWDAYKAGLVILVQQRLDRNSWKYMAVKI